MSNHAVMSKACSLLAACMMLAAVLAGCAMASKPLPADWPLKMNIFPRDAEIRTVISSKNTAEEMKKAYPAKADLIADKMKEGTIWTVAFTTEMSQDEYFAFMDSKLGRKGYRYIDPDVSGYEHLEAGMIRDYYSPDGTISISTFYMPIVGFTLTVTQDAKPNTSRFDSALPIK